MLIQGANVIKLLFFWRVDACQCWEIGQWLQPMIRCQDSTGVQAHIENTLPVCKCRVIQ